MCFNVETFVRLVFYSLFVPFVLTEYISLSQDFLYLFEGYDEGAMGYQPS